MNRKGAGGRPRKFKEASRPVTVTLSESALKQLEIINPDRALAIAKAAAMATRAHADSKHLVEIVEVLKGTGLIIIGPSRALRQIPFLHLVEVAPARYLLALTRGNDSAALEIALHDLLDDLPKDEHNERLLIEQLLAQIRRLRKSRRVSMAEILFVDLAAGG